MQPVLFEFDVARWVLDVGRFTSMSHVTVRPAVAPYQLGVGEQCRIRAHAVVANGFDRTTFHRFFAERFLLWALWLLVNIGMTAVVVTLKIGGRSFAAQIAVDALIIDVEFARYVFSIFVRNVGHG